MEQVLREQQSFNLPYIDDVIIFSKIGPHIWRTLDEFLRLWGRLA